MAALFTFITAANAELDRGRSGCRRAGRGAARRSRCMNGVLDLVPGPGDGRSGAGGVGGGAAGGAAGGRGRARDFAEADRIRDGVGGAGDRDRGHAGGYEVEAGGGERRGSSVYADKSSMGSWLDTCVAVWYSTSLAQNGSVADVAQLAEHLICNQAVASSTLAVSSRSNVAREVWRAGEWWARERGGVPKWPTGADCKSAGLRLRRFESFPHHLSGCGGRRVAWREAQGERGSSSAGRAQAFQA